MTSRVLLVPVGNRGLLGASLYMAREAIGLITLIGLGLYLYGPSSLR